MSYTFNCLDVWAYHYAMIYFNLYMNLLPLDVVHSLFLAAGDDVVEYKHGERSAHALNSVGFRNLTFRTYNGYLIGSNCVNNNTDSHTLTQHTQNNSCILEFN